MIILKINDITAPGILLVVEVVVMKIERDDSTVLV
jgi:hypothetical protein